MKLGVMVVALVFLASSAAGSTSTLTIGTTNVTAKWKESYVKGSVSFTGSETNSIDLEASLRNVATARLIQVKRFSVSAGNFSNSIPLSARPVPGTYRLRLKEMPTGSAADRNVTIPAPPEGVIDIAYMTNTKTGARKKVIKNAKVIYAHFHFVARPQTNTLTFKWQKPGNPKVRFTGFATKRYATTIDTFVCVKRTSGGSCLDVPLQKGKWYCIVYAKGKVVKRQDVRVT
jgi:hypothetical protein